MKERILEAKPGRRSSKICIFDLRSKLQRISPFFPCFYQDSRDSSQFFPSLLPVNQQNFFIYQLVGEKGWEK